ncbi:hypothetical protein niasHT_001936 [Heterodera trifolii]|uniref:Voltage-dependent anion-selective channel protein 3 n=1 Tax=Heterodera trifolii TaxID=157864 RepID=A0ABD2LSF1_9BILA
MAPPKFSDLGKSAKDLFSKGYAHGFMKLDVTSDVAPTVQFKTSAAHDLNSQKLDGNLEVKYKILEHGLTITEKWKTDNQLTNVLELKDKVLRGLTLTVETAFKPHVEGSRHAIAKADWANDAFHVNGDLTLFGGPLFTGSFVAKMSNDWLVGAQLKANLEQGTVGPTAISIGRKTAEYSLHSHTTDGTDFGASLYHRVHKNLEYGVQMGWKTGDAMASWAVATKYNMSPELTLRAKMDHNSRVSVSAVHNLNGTLKLTLSSHFAMAAFPDAQNKFGFGLEYCPGGTCCAKVKEDA